MRYVGYVSILIFFMAHFTCWGDVILPTPTATPGIETPTPGTSSDTNSRSRIRRVAYYDHTSCIVTTGRTTSNVSLACTDQQKMNPIESTNWKQIPLTSLLGREREVSIYYGKTNWCIASIGIDSRKAQMSCTRKDSDPLNIESWNRVPFETSLPDNEEVTVATDFNRWCIVAKNSSDKSFIRCTQPLKNTLLASSWSPETDITESVTKEKDLSLATDGVRWCLATMGVTDGNVHLNCTGEGDDPIQVRSWSRLKTDLGAGKEISLASDGKRWCMAILGPKPPKSFKKSLEDEEPLLPALLPGGVEIDEGKPNVALACSESGVDIEENPTWSYTKLPIFKSMKEISLSTDGKRWCISTINDSKETMIGCTKLDMGSNELTNPTDKRNWEITSLVDALSKEGKISLGLSSTCSMAGEFSPTQTCCPGLVYEDQFCMAPTLPEKSPPVIEWEQDGCNTRISGRNKREYRTAKADFAAIEAMFPIEAPVIYYVNRPNGSPTPSPTPTSTPVEEPSLENLRDKYIEQFGIIDSSLYFFDILKWRHDRLNEERAKYHAEYAKYQTALNLLSTIRDVKDTRLAEALVEAQIESEGKEAQLIALEIKLKMDESNAIFFQKVSDLSIQFHDYLLTAYQLSANESWNCSNMALKFCTLYRLYDRRKDYYGPPLNNIVRTFVRGDLHRSIVMNTDLSAVGNSVPILPQYRLNQYNDALNMDLNPSTRKLVPINIENLAYIMWKQYSYILKPIRGEEDKKWKIPGRENLPLYLLEKNALIAEYFSVSAYISSKRKECVQDIIENVPEGGTPIVEDDLTGTPTVDGTPLDNTPTSSNTPNDPNYPNNPNYPNDPNFPNNPNPPDSYNPINPPPNDPSSSLTPEPQPPTVSTVPANYVPPTHNIPAPVAPAPYPNAPLEPIKNIPSNSIGNKNSNSKFDSNNSLKSLLQDNQARLSKRLGIGDREKMLQSQLNDSKLRDILRQKQGDSKDFMKALQGDSAAQHLAFSKDTNGLGGSTGSGTGTGMGGDAGGGIDGMSSPYSGFGSGGLAGAGGGEYGGQDNQSYSGMGKNGNDGKSGNTVDYQQGAGGEGGWKSFYGSGGAGGGAGGPKVSGRSGDSDYESSGDGVESSALMMDPNQNPELQVNEDDSLFKKIEKVHQRKFHDQMFIDDYDQKTSPFTPDSLYR